MPIPPKRRPPGKVRDAIIDTIKEAQRPLSVKEIADEVKQRMGDVPTSSIRSYLRLNTPELFMREARGYYSCAFDQPELAIRPAEDPPKAIKFPFKLIGKGATLFNADCFDWLKRQALNILHDVVTYQPYVLFEYTQDQDAKNRGGRGG